MTENPRYEYYIDGTVRCKIFGNADGYHRANGPAYTSYREDGTVESEVWFWRGSRHRIDGPAIVWYNDDGTVDNHRRPLASRQWYYHGDDFNIQELKEYIELPEEDKVAIKLAFG